jgi:Polyketide cyclase / dehydrase and lipid transport
VFTASVAILVARPQDEVFDFVADARNRPQWDESVETEELTSPEPIGVGTTIRTRLKPSLGRRAEYTWEVVEHEPPSRMTIDSTSGPFPTSLEWRLTGNGGDTRAEFSVRGSPHGLMRLMQPLIARTIQQNLDRNFPRLKQLLEARPAPGPTPPRS